jgi:hypothetical protein
MSPVVREDDVEDVLGAAVVDRAHQSQQHGASPARAAIARLADRYCAFVR